MIKHRGEALTQAIMTSTFKGKDGEELREQIARWLEKQGFEHNCQYALVEIILERLWEK